MWVSFLWNKKLKNKQLVWARWMDIFKLLNLWKLQYEIWITELILLLIEIRKKFSDRFYIWTSASYDSPFNDKNSRYKNHYEKSWRKFVEQLIQQLRRGLNRIMIKFMIASSQNGTEYDEIPSKLMIFASFSRFWWFGLHHFLTHPRVPMGI